MPSIWRLNCETLKPAVYGFSPVVSGSTSCETRGASCDLTRTGSEHAVNRLGSKFGRDRYTPVESEEATASAIERSM